MKIEGSQMGSNGVHSSGLNSGGEDSISKSLKKQIENVQNEIKSLSANKDMPPKEKQERSKQLRQELAELKRQLSQHQIEKQKEQREQRMQKTEGQKSEENSPKKKREGGSMDAAAMQGLIASNAAMDRTRNAASLKTELEDSARITRTEIKLDGGRGQDTGLKQESLEKTEDKIASLDNFVKVQAEEAVDAAEKGQKAGTAKEEEAAEDRDEKDMEEKEAQETERKIVSYKRIDILL